MSNSSIRKEERLDERLDGLMMVVGWIAGGVLLVKLKEPLQ
jgi:hypothetical protein